MKKYLFLFFLIANLGCQEEVDLPLATIEGDVPIIEGNWTDVPSLNEVKISLAQNYFDNEDATIIGDAEVFIRNLNTGEAIPFQFLSQFSIYKPADPRRVAVIGERYELIVQWRGNEYRSRGEMLPPPILDSLNYEYQEERIFREEGYYIKAFGKIPFEEDNYYRIRIIENDTLKNDRDDYLLFDDTFGVEFFEEGLELNYAFEEGDRVRLELFRMNKDVFDYFNQLVGLLFNDGGLFSPPPQNPDTNIQIIQGQGPVLGYFLVGPVLQESIDILAEE
ncbi:DUF4249 domain-containing protein [Algoriphagus kandeliae]|uniref:DUF4249 domain-containing protein n=1 Tax=Algoriphagus kandeliae TaxID=2562278 RepID=A0A4Y9QYH0_9BACT|nr:DUF4249 family protein [Algoriphagus kandeliae]TFV97544.1 DUF4249 domain-containing protein [Algoriphagus kandeliae]